MKINGILTKSNNAIYAEEVLGYVTYSRLSAWQKRAVDANAVRPREWHHTSAAANKTDYYAPEDFETLNPADFPAKKTTRAAQADLTRLKISISFRRMTGGFSTGARKKFELVKVEGLDVRKKDNKIIGAGGRRLDSNNEEIHFYYLPPRCRKWREITRAQAIELGYNFI